MLTATYSMLAISAEQKNSRSILARLQQTLRHCFERVGERGLPELEAAIERLSQFDRYWHGRSMEMYVIPAIRGASRETDALLAELDSLSARGIAILRAAREGLRSAFHAGSDYLGELMRALEVYCENLWERQAKEENELMPLVGRVLTSEQWFPIATKMLSVPPARRPGGSTLAS